MIEPCECELGCGFCIKHNIRKPDAWVKLCQRSEKYRQAWNQGHGPGQGRTSKEPQQTALLNHWCSLHYYPVKHAANWDARRAKRWYAGWVAAIPNSRGCGCREHWKAMDVQFDFSTPAAFFASSVDGHNRVSESLGKPTITLAEAY